MPDAKIKHYDAPCLRSEFALARRAWFWLLLPPFLVAHVHMRTKFKLGWSVQVVHINQWSNHYHTCVRANESV